MIFGCVGNDFEPRDEAADAFARGVIAVGSRLPDRRVEPEQFHDGGRDGDLLVGRTLGQQDGEKTINGGGRFGERHCGLGLREALVHATPHELLLELEDDGERPGLVAKRFGLGSDAEEPFDERRHVRRHPHEDVRDRDRVSATPAA